MTRRRGRERWSFEGLSNREWLELSLGPFGDAGRDGFTCLRGDCVPPFRQHEGGCEESFFASEADREAAWWATRDVYLLRPEIVGVVVAGCRRRVGR